jgi:60 kDa SS-A/Ro ribonucleoprotein
MARTNVRIIKPAPRTHEGAVAARITDEQQLRRSVMSCLLWEKEFYESGEVVANRIARLASSLPTEVVAGIAIEAREKMHLRHVPLWLVRAMAPNGGRIVGDTLARVIKRPDELGEFLSLYWKDGKTPLAKQVKRGLADAFGKFDEYQLAKWNREGDVRLLDVMRLVHPTPATEEQAALWGRLRDGTLATPETWEVLLSSGRDKNEVWTHLLLDDKLGGLALLRNLRNMLQAGVDRSLIREAINNNAFHRVLPFRFIAAAAHAPELEPELEQAMFRAASSLDRLPGKTALVVDHSGSMLQPLSSKSDVTRFDAAAALAILLREVAEDVDIIAFSAPGAVHGYHAVYHGGSRKGQAVDLGVGRPPVALVPPRRGFALRDALEVATPWWGTNTEDAKQMADQRGYDRVIILTDEQSHQKITAPAGKGYVINVASARNGIGYGPWVHIDGWSENVVHYIASLEAGGVAAV